MSTLTDQPWKTLDPLPWGLAAPGIGQLGNKIFVVGGYRGSVKPPAGTPFNIELDIIEIQADGKLRPPVVTGAGPISSHGTGMSDPKVLVTGNIVYMLGGNDGSSSFSHIVQALILSGGSDVGVFTQPGTLSLPNAGSGTPMLLGSNGYLYVLGATGAIQCLKMPSDHQLATSLFVSGTLGIPGGDAGWKLALTTTALTISTYATWVEYGGYLYIIGGYSNGTVPLQDIYSMKMNADGSLGKEKLVGCLITGRTRHCGVQVGRQVYIMAGYDIGNNYLSSCETVTLESGGQVSAPKALQPLPIPVRNAAAFHHGGRLFFMGGYDGVNSYPNVYSLNVGTL